VRNDPWGVGDGAIHGAEHLDRNSLEHRLLNTLTPQVPALSVSQDVDRLLGLEVHLLGAGLVECLHEGLDERHVASR
jgi:hypothetical protein